jgi:hypothetical protein
MLKQAIGARANVLAGTGRWREARVLLDSLRMIEPRKARGIEAWAVVLGLTPHSFRSILDSVVKEMPPGPEAVYAAAMLHVIKGQVAEGRRILARELARESTAIPDPIRGVMIAGDGCFRAIRWLGSGACGLDWSSLLHRTKRVRFRGFSSRWPLPRQETRDEGIRWPRYGFETLPLYKPLTLLALGHTFEAAGQRDSAAVAYSRFLRLWDKADPDLQGRVREAREGLHAVTRE